MSCLPRRRLVSITLVAFSCLLATPSLGDFRDDYKAGLEAFESADWPSAVSSFERAIKERSEARVSFRRYTPHYFLGAALEAQGRCRAAIRAWDEAERQGQIKKTKDYQDLRRRRQACKKKVQAIDGEAAQIESLLAQAREQEEELEGMSQEAPLAAKWGLGGQDSLASQQAVAARLLDQAESDLGRGRSGGDSDLFEQARQATKNGMNLMTEVAVAAKSRLRDQRQAVASAKEDILRVESNADRSLQALSDLRPFPPELGRRARAVEAALASLREAKDKAAPAEIADLSDALTVAVSGLRRASTRPPSSLLKAAGNLFKGKYSAVIDGLVEKGYRGRTLIQSQVILAAAQHALYLLGGKQNPELFIASRANILASAGAGRVAPPMPEAYFSPSFLRFYAHILNAEKPENADSGALGAASEQAADRSGS